MADVSVGTTAATLDSGASGYVRVTNKGSQAATVSRGTDKTVLWPNSSTTFVPAGLPVTAKTASGSTTIGVDTGSLDSATSSPGADLPAALALKAPLASPAFTGNPTAPTATPGDADTSLATTGFVKAAVDQKTLLPDTAPSAAATGTLTVGQLARVDASGGARTRTLPSAAAAGAGGVVAIRKTDTTTNTITIARAGSDTINGSATSRVVTPPEVALTLVSDGVSNWSVVSTDTPASNLSATYVRTVNGTGPDGSGNVAVAGGSSTVVVLSGAGIDLTGATDSAAAVQAILTANAGKVIKTVPGATYRFGSALVMPSGQTIDATGSTMNWVGASGDGLTNVAAVTPVRSTSAAAITVGSYTLTDATAAFTAGDVGRSVTVAGAGAASQNLCANITAVTDGSTVTLDTAAKFSVSGASLKIYTRDTDITVVGGTWTRDSTSTSHHFLVFRRCDRISIRPQVVDTAGGIYAVDFGHVTDYEARDIKFTSTVKDGVHVNGPAARGRIMNISGKCSDDVIGITATDYISNPYWAECVGDITDLSVSNINKPVAGGTAIVRALGGRGSRLRRLHIDHITGVSNMSCVTVMDWPADSGTVGNDCTDVVISNVTATVTGSNEGVIRLGGAGLGSVSVDNVTMGEGSHASANLIQLDSRATGSTIDLVATNLTCRGATSWTLLSLQTGATWKSIQLANVRHVGSAGAGAALFVQAASGPVVVNGIHVTGSGSFVNVAATSGTVTLHASDIVLEAPTSGIIVAGACTVRGTVNGISGNTTSGLVNMTAAGAVVDLDVQGNRISSGGLLTRSATQTARITGETAKVDLSALTPTDGDVAYNTNGALACGLGPAVYRAGGAPNGWKGLYSGTVYESAISPIFVSDLFAGTASTAITAHTPDTGGAWTLRSGAASLTLDGAGKVALASANGSYTTWYNAATPSSADYSVTMDVTPTSATDTEVGPCIRASSSATTFVAAHMALTNPGYVTRLVLSQANAGAISNIGQTSAAVAFSAGVTYRITLIGAGTAITARCQRLSDSYWLASDGTWQVAQADAITGTTVVTATGYAGIVAAQAVSNGTTIDNYTASV